MHNINRYTTTDAIAKDVQKPEEGRTTPTIVISSVICGDTLGVTITATASVGC